jgi:predicted TIM-barrel fold metal-dependent hydrolase
MTDQDRLIVVSGDAHAGPRLREDLRPYCSRQHLDDYDTWVEANATRAVADWTEGRHNLVVAGLPYEQDASNEAKDHAGARMRLNQQTLGHFDIATRIAEMDYDGVAAEVIFHGSQNDEPLPFIGLRDWAAAVTAGTSLELFAVGYDIYNRWLADFVSVQPERHVGLAYVPMWDVDLAVSEVERAASRGLRGVNFPAPRRGIREYDDPAWEPFWSACEANQMVLSTHAGVPFNDMSGPQMTSVMLLESAGWPARRGMYRMVFGGVFERHPGLHLVLTETTRGWWTHAKRELDLIYGRPSPALRRQVPKRPSEYMESNVFIGASFMPREEVDEATAEGYVDKAIWGRDYPHGEGTYKYPETPDEESMTRQCIRWTFAESDPDVSRAILGENAIRAYYLDSSALAKVANRIGPTPGEVSTPLVDRPHGWHDDLFGVGVA